MQQLQAVQEKVLPDDEYPCQWCRHCWHQNRPSSSLQVYQVCFHIRTVVRQTHHCHVVVLDLCTLGAVKECPSSWPHLGDLLVEGHCPLQLPRLLCIIGAPLVLHGTSTEHEHLRLSAAGNAHCIDTHAAAWTGSVKAPVFSGPWGHLLCSLAQSKASLQLDVYVSSLSGSHECACSLYHVLM